jgi:hypothetical protein
MTPEESKRQKAIIAAIMKDPDNPVFAQAIADRSTPARTTNASQVMDPTAELANGMSAFEYQKEYGEEGSKAYYDYLMGQDPTGDLALQALVEGDILYYAPPYDAVPDGSGLVFGGENGGYIPEGPMGSQNVDDIEFPGYDTDSGGYEGNQGGDGNPYGRPNGGMGAGNGGGSSDTSWDWSQFKGREGDNVAPPYTAQYSLGEESPWGNLGQEGGNLQFYKNQLNNLNAQSQAHQTSAFAAAMRRQAAMDNPQEPQEMDWGWANKGEGLRDVNVAGEDTGGYDLNSNFTNDTTNQEIMEWWQPRGSQDDQDFWSAKIALNDPGAQQTNWANAGDPNTLIDQLGPVVEDGSPNRDRMSTLFQNIYGKNASSTGSTPSGYATPI